MNGNKKMEKYLKMKIRETLRKKLKKQIEKELDDYKKELQSGKKEYLTEVELLSHLYKLNTGS